VGGVALLATACTATSSPTASVSTQPSPSPSASQSPSPSPLPSQSPSPSGPAVSIAGLPVHNAEVGVGYLAVQLGAKDGTPPYTWSVDSGQLPPGLVISEAGVVSGTNTKAGTFTFVAKVTDSAGATATGSAKIIVFPSFTATSLCAKACNVGVGCTVCGTFGKLAGGAGPYTYKLLSGAAPTGMTLKSLSVTGPFPTPPTSGAPAPSLSVQVTDGFDVSRVVSASWNIFPALDFVATDGAPGTGCYNGTAPGNCSDSSLTYTLGNPSDQVKVVAVKACYDDVNANYICSTGKADLASYLPPGWTASASGGVVTVGMDCGTPDQCGARTGSSNWYGDVYIVLVDMGGCVAPGASQSSYQADVNIDI
jgi:hypothetical protein